MVSFSIAERLYAISEYLDLEDKAEVRHEFNNGTIVEMAGALLPHNLIKIEILTALNIAIKSAKVPNVVLNSNTKLRIERQNRFVYPDITLSDGIPEYYTTPEGKIRRDTLINPLLIIEVLSDDTRADDKGEKFEAYSSIPGFREYVLIEPEIPWIKVQYLQDPSQNLWQIDTLTEPAGTLHLRTLNLRIPIVEIYAALEKLPK